MNKDFIKKWYDVVKNEDEVALEGLLDDNVTFHSPIVHTPQLGKKLTNMYLQASLKVFSKKSNFTYVREVASANNLVLEFVATIDGITVNGVDMITFNELGKITDFKVMIRPLKAINLIHQLMMGELQKNVNA